MDNYVANSFDKNYAMAWSLDQGGFSSSLAQNLLEYIKKNKLAPKSCLDIACGTGEFLSYFSKAGLACSGTEIAESMVEFCKNKYPNGQFVLVKDLASIPFKTKFDIITCNHDMVNTLEKFSQWQAMFKNVASSLNKGGLFMFDFYTKNKLANWNEVIYEESDNVDHVSQVKKGIDNKCVIKQTYYIKQKGQYKKTFDVQVEAYFENNEIVAALEKAGFKEIELCNFSLEKLDDAEARNRVHVIAKK